MSPTPGFGNCAPPPRKSLVEYARQRSGPATARPPARRPRRLRSAKHLFDPNALTLGFARRFATYKRPNLLLHDPGATAAPVDQSAAPGATHPCRQGPSGGRRRGRR